MAGRQLLCLSTAFVLLSAAFAGCMGGDEPTTAEPMAVNETLSDNVTVDDGTTEMDVDVGHMPHLHDYWQGKERATIMDEDVTVDQFRGFAFTFFNVFRGTPGVGGTFFTFPEGSLVYEGTGKMEITATWSDPTVTGAGIQYRSPATESFSETIPLQQGSPFSLDISPDMTDMPHDKESRWMFLLVPGSTGQSVMGKVHFKVDIVRLSDITVFPGHPELFAGEHTLTLYEGAAKSSSSNFATMMAGFITGNDPDEGVRSSKVVPMETLTMTANVTITSATSSLGQVASVDFLYKPAGSFGFERAQVLSADTAAGVYQFAWPVSMRQTDSPYAETSQWMFDLLIHTDSGAPTPFPIGRGITDAQVDYTLTAVAYDTLLEGVEPIVEDEDNGN